MCLTGLYSSILGVGFDLFWRRPNLYQLMANVQQTVAHCWHKPHWVQYCPAISFLRVAAVFICLAFAWSQSVASLCGLFYLARALSLGQGDSERLTIQEGPWTRDALQESREVWEVIADGLSTNICSILQVQKWLDSPLAFLSLLSLFTSLWSDASCALPTSSSSSSKEPSTLGVAILAVQAQLRDRFSTTSSMTLKLVTTLSKCSTMSSKHSSITSRRALRSSKCLLMFLNWSFTFSMAFGSRADGNVRFLRKDSDWFVLKCSLSSVPVSTAHMPI